jgi:hypothetical protein
MSIYSKLNAARAKFHALKLEKTGHNKFAGYYYFELGDFLIPALRIFDEVGLCAIVSFDKELATMTIVDIQAQQIDTKPHYITITSPLSEANLKGCHPIQNVGACETYCRRYLWVAALEIVEHDALDATTGKDQKEKTGIPLNVKASGPKLIFAELQPEDQDYCRKIAKRAIEFMPEVSRVIDLLDNEGMNNFQKIGVWNLLPSATRSAIKKAQDKMKMPSRDLTGGLEANQSNAKD